MHLPQAELLELAEILDSGNLHVLRDRYAGARLVRQGLLRFTGRVWLFPFGVRPDLRQPVKVSVNGVLQHMDEEVALVSVGKMRPITAAVMWRPLDPDEVVLASYVAVPEESP